MQLHPLFSKRRAGVLLHLTSLPDGGRSLKTAMEFIDWLSAAGFTWWQMLPVGPPGPGLSPYSSPSAFAGDVSLLAAAKLDGNFQDFVQAEAYWLQDWASWACCSGWTKQSEMEVVLDQFQFQLAWQHLRQHATKRGIHLLGDIPIFVEKGSADVAAHADLFRLNPDGTPEVVTGVPPDCFSETGQLWGHPHYNWPKHHEQNFEWWLQRFTRQLRLFDAVRIDHFIGFHNAWEVDGSADTAEDGSWQQAPGREILTTLLDHFRQKDQSNALPLLAEDLGEVTPPVHALRDEFHLPGMRILQNAFYDDNSGNLPENCPSQSVTYTGTHDNQTIAAWLDELDSDSSARLQPHLQSAGNMIDLALSSGSNLVILPMQDLLDLGAHARMNTPATTEGNWHWKLSADALTSDLAAKLRQQLEGADRLS